MREDLPAYIPEVPYEHSRVRTSDGVSLYVLVAGEGPTVLLANGIGVIAPGLDLIADHLVRRYRVVAWDYRGIHRSVVKEPPVEFTMQRHATDALEILDALDEERAAVLGWSMGVPVGLEMIRQQPERIAGYGALFGAPGRPFRAAFPLPVALLVEGLFKGSRYCPRPMQTILDLGRTLPPVAWALCSSIWFVGPDAHPEIFHRDVCSTCGAEKQAYLATMKHLLEHDGRDYLPRIACPTLVVAGTDDWLTPPEAAEEMASAIPDSRFLVLSDTSHFGVIEHGPLLWDPIDELLAQAFSDVA